MPQLVESLVAARYRTGTGPEKSAGITPRNSYET